MKNVIGKYYNEFINALDSVEFTIDNNIVESQEFIEKIIDKLIFIKKYENSIYFIGNGGSCSIASHFATDFTKNAGIRSFSNNDGSLLTCFSNDYSFETSYLEIMKVYFKKNDLLIAISSSGMSKNIVNAAEFVNNSNLITLTGFSKNNDLRIIGKYNIYVKSNNFGIVESIHSYYLHLIFNIFTGKI